MIDRQHAALYVDLNTALDKEAAKADPDRMFQRVLLAKTAITSVHLMMIKRHNGYLEHFSCHLSLVQESDDRADPVEDPIFSQ